MLSGGPKRVQCPEDDEFLNAFEKMVSENLQVRNTLNSCIITLYLQALLSIPLRFLLMITVYFASFMVYVIPTCFISLMRCTIHYLVTSARKHQGARCGHCHTRKCEASEVYVVLLVTDIIYNKRKVLF